MPVSDFGRNYKNRHHLDYQYEGDTKDDSKNNQAVETNEIDLQKVAKPKSLKANVQMARNSVLEESAVIQQSNKLHLVETGLNRSLSEAHQVTPQVRLSQIGSRGFMRRQGMASQIINTRGSPQENAKLAKRKKTGASLPTKYKQPLKGKKVFYHRPSKVKKGAGIDSLGNKPAANSKRPESERVIQTRGNVNFHQQENRHNVKMNRIRQHSPVQEDSIQVVRQRKLLFERALNGKDLAIFFALK